MKRFYKEVSVISRAEGHAIKLDGKPVRTPARALLAVHSLPLANAIAAEWETQADKIDPRTMPLTGLANAAIDRVSADPIAFAADLATYGETDLLCYRAEDPPVLVERQAKSWDVLLGWAQGRYDVAFTIVGGIMHKPQPAATIDRLAAAIAAHDPFALAGLSPLVTISGSLVAALAVAEQAITPEDAFDATHLDEIWQAETWGEDELATKARDARRLDFIAAARFVALTTAR